MKDWKHLTIEQRKVISNGISHNYKLKDIATFVIFLLKLIWISIFIWKYVFFIKWCIYSNDF